MSRFARFILVLVLCLGGLAVSATVATPSAVAATTYSVYNTSGDGLFLHPDSSTIHSAVSDLMPDGTTFDIQCWTYGDDVNGDAVWDYGTNESTGNSGYAADFHLDTPVHQGQEGPELATLGIPQCGSSAPSLSTPTSRPVDIHLYVDGTREENLLGLTPELQAAADAAGIDGQELARIIYHEGGNYLDSSWRRAITQQAESALPFVDSVGIAQVKVGTARNVDSWIYGADDSAISDDAIKSRLIYDQNFSIYMAAGYLRILQDEGLEDGWSQFMAYNMPPETALAWKEAGHPMDTASLAALGLDPETEQARQQSYNDTLAAVG